jgi:hypothetical protein
MKLRLKGLFDPRTNAGLEYIVIELCRGMRATSYPKLCEKREELGKALMQAKLDKTDLNTAIYDIIPEALNLCIDFNEINDIKTIDPQIDVTMYEVLYGDAAALLLISDLRNSEHGRRMEKHLVDMENQLADVERIRKEFCLRVFDTLYVADKEDTMESIEADVRKLICFDDLTKIDLTRFNNLYGKDLGPRFAEKTLRDLGLLQFKKPIAQRTTVPPIIFGDTSSSTQHIPTGTMSPVSLSNSPENSETRSSGTLTPRGAFLYFRDKSPPLPSFRKLSFRGFTPIGLASPPNSVGNSVNNSRVPSPVSVADPDVNLGGFRTVSPIKFKKLN